MEIELKRVARYKLELFFDEKDLDSVKALIRDGFDERSWVPGSEMQQFAVRFKKAFKQAFEQ